MIKYSPTDILYACGINSNKYIYQYLRCGYKVQNGVKVPIIFRIYRHPTLGVTKVLVLSKNGSPCVTDHFCGKFYKKTKFCHFTANHIRLLEETLGTTDAFVYENIIITSGKFTLKLSDGKTITIL